jgi:hypothetical protein
VSDLQAKCRQPVERLAKIERIPLALSHDLTERGDDCLAAPFTIRPSLHQA